jgi:hypothetical protein
MEMTVIQEHLITESKNDNLLGPASPVSDASDMEEGERDNISKYDLSRGKQGLSPTSLGDDGDSGASILSGDLGPFWSSSGKLPSSDTREVGDNPCFPLLRSYLEILSLSPSW